MTRLRALRGLLLAAGISLAPGGARAAAPPPPAGVVSPATAELQRTCDQLRRALERTNAEVASLKRDRGVGADYRLRRKMAEAEALARRLTEAETALRRATGAPRPASGTPLALPPLPAAEPHDGPVELEAKADILADRARRLSREAEALQDAASRMKARQTLKRRAGQLERDPFASLEGSKRTMIIAGPRPQAERTATSDGAFSGSPRSASGGPEAAPQTAGGAGPGVATAPPVQDTKAGPPPALTAPGAESARPAAQAAASPPPVSPAPEPAPATAAALPLQTRALLDPQTLSELGRVERTAGTSDRAGALERAAAVLRARAASLEADAKALRARAKP